MTELEETLGAPGDPRAQGPVVTSQRPVVTSQRPVVTSQRPVVTSQEPIRPSQEPTRLSVDIQDLPEGTVIAVGGELDLLTAPQLAAVVDPILAVDHRHIAIDLTATSFMDSAGVHALVNISNRAHRRFAVICPAGTARRTIELIGLAEPLSVVDSLDEYRRRRAGS
jgi:anti-sigma B factor antagonist